MSVVVADTSVWVDFLAGRPTPHLEDALRLGSILLPPIVAAELLSGVRARDRDEMIALLSSFELADTPLSHWMAVGDLRSMLLRKGLRVSTPDAHVAQCALERDAVLLTHDAVFGRMAALTELRIARG